MIINHQLLIKIVKESIVFINQTIALINYYSFDLGEYTAKDLIVKWSKKYVHFWLPLAVLEAIYQGRFKAISIEQILNLWHKHGIPHYQFSEEFGSLISNNIFANMDDLINLDESRESDQDEVILSEDLISINTYNQEKTNNCSAIILYKPPIKKFEPLEDFSHCYSKLKSLTNYNRKV